MKHKPAILLVILGGLFIALAFLTQRAAAASCFTDTGGHWAETFVCWLKTNNLSGGYPDGSFKPDNNITRAEVAVFMQKVNDLAVSQDATNLAAAKTYADSKDAITQTQLIQYTNDYFLLESAFNAGPTSFQVWGGDLNGRIEYFSEFARMRSSAVSATTNPYTASITVPSNMYGSEMAVSGAKLCYDAATGGATLNNVSFDVHESDGTSWRIIEDNVVRTDGPTCRTYDFTLGPGALFGGYHVNLSLLVDFTNNTKFLDVYSVTVYLTPTGNSATP